MDKVAEKDNEAIGKNSKGKAKNEQGKGKNTSERGKEAQEKDREEDKRTAYGELLFGMPGSSISGDEEGWLRHA